MLESKYLRIALLSCAVLGQVQPAGAQAARLGSTGVAIPAGVLGTAIEYDSRNSVYLIVGAGGGIVWGRFVSADGAVLGSPFGIQTAPIYGQYPRAAYSPDADNGNGAFLVTWAESSLGGGNTAVHARLVSYARGGPFGAETQVGHYAKYTAGSAVRYSTGSREFMVAWQNYMTNDIDAVRVSNAGTVLASVPIPATGDGERDPDVAYNPVTDEFLIVYTGWGSYTFTRALRVKAGGGGVGAPVELFAGTGTYITSVTYNSQNNTFLAAWYALPQGATLGRVIAANGTPAGDVTLLSSRWKAYDALGIAYNPLTNTSFMVSHSHEANVGGVEIAASGVPVDNGGLVTDIGGALGNFYPLIAAATNREEWMLTASNDFAQAIYQRIRGTRVGAAAPAPPPSCTVTFSSAGNNFGPAGGAGAVTATASPSGCSWSVSASASWIGVSGGGSRSGSGTISYSVAPYGGLGTRTGTITAGGRTYNIGQSGVMPTARRFDFNEDGHTDVLWQNRASGELALWRMNGLQVTASTLLNPASVADTGWKVVGSTDLNRDGYADLVWQHDTGYVAAWLMRGDTMISGDLITTRPLSDRGWRIVATGDLDNDGWGDLLWQHTSGAIAVWYMEGLRMRSGENVGNMQNPHWRVSGADDFNGDGHLDLVLRNVSDGEIVVWLLNDRALLSSQSLSRSVPNPQWEIVGTGDHNADGRPDLLWRNSTTGELAVWLMQGLTFLGSATPTPGQVPNTNWVVVGPR